jgi:hypothetical protein
MAFVVAAVAYSSQGTVLLVPGALDLRVPWVAVVVVGIPVLSVVSALVAILLVVYAPCCQKCRHPKVQRKYTRIRAHMRTLNLIIVTHIFTRSHARTLNTHMQRHCTAQTNTHLGTLGKW